jgi:hypothetical protein
MTWEIEVLKFLMFFAAGSLLIWFAGFVYGLNKKLGILLIVTGVTGFLSFILVALFVFSSDLVSGYSWGAAAGGFLLGLMSNSIWNQGKSFGSKVKVEWRSS